MSEWVIKKGMASVEVKNYLATLKDEDYIRISIELETPKKRLRGGFHSLLNAWYKSGEFSIEVKTEKGLKRYYKFVGCNWETSYFEYKGDEFKTAEELYNAYPDFEPNSVTRQPRHWEDMTKKQQCKALDGMITDINMSQCNNKDVLYKLSLITNDIEMLNWLKWDKYQKEKNRNVDNICNKFNGVVQ